MNHVPFAEQLKFCHKNGYKAVVADMKSTVNFGETLDRLKKLLSLNKYANRICTTVTADFPRGKLRRQKDKAAAKKGGEGSEGDDSGMCSFECFVVFLLCVVVCSLLFFVEVVDGCFPC